MAHTIIGVDPGKTAAIACLDLNGRVVHLEHARFAGFDWFVGKIRKLGTPVIIASDKKNSTHLIDRLGAAFGTKVYMPDTDISVRRKEEMVVGICVSNMHERDALAAAITAYHAYENKFKQAEKLARESSYENIDKLKAMVVKKYSIHDTITSRKAGKRE
ncbi:MAG: DUF460 domain-containing protein [Candidatus Micrarchaeota archaeon]|nr:DUF460 domain-containing protein [Candidatus Micrarchaeota archaeon]